MGPGLCLRIVQGKLFHERLAMHNFANLTPAQHEVASNKSKQKREMLFVSNFTFLIQ